MVLAWFLWVLCGPLVDWYWLLFGVVFPWRQAPDLGTMAFPTLGSAVAEAKVAKERVRQLRLCLAISHSFITHPLTPYRPLDVSHGVPIVHIGC